MYEVKEHSDFLSIEQEALIRELSVTDPELTQRSSREKMVDAAIAAAKEQGATFGESDEELRAAAIAFLDYQIENRLGT